MGLFKSIFRRKPGGTMLGNIFRGVAKAIPIAGPLLGNGGMMITAEQAAERAAKEAAGQTANLPILNDAAKAQIGAGVAGAYESIVALGQPQGVYNPANPLAPYQAGAKDSIVKKYGIVAGIVAGALVLVLVIVKMFKK